MKYPCRGKYLEEATGGYWIIFGEHPDGTVDISNSHGDILTQVPRESAERIVAAQAVLMNVIYAELAMR